YKGAFDFRIPADSIAAGIGIHSDRESQALRRSFRDIGIHRSDVDQHADLLAVDFPDHHGFVLLAANPYFGELNEPALGGGRPRRAENDRYDADPKIDGDRYSSHDAHIRSSFDHNIST